MLGYSLLGILGLLVLLLCIPVSLGLHYYTGEPPQAYLRWLFLRFDLKNLQKTKAKKRIVKEVPTAKPMEEPARRSPMEFTELMAAVLDLLSAAKDGAGFLIRRFRLFGVRLHMTVAEGDAAETAIAYGKVNAAVYGGYAFAKGFLNMADPDIQIRPDFTQDKGIVDFELHGRLLPIHAIAAAGRIGMVFLVKTIRRKKREAQQTAPNTGRDSE